MKVVILSLLVLTARHEHQAQWYANDVVYVKDVRTGLCCAHAGLGTSSVMSNVPCITSIETLINANQE